MSGDTLVSTTVETVTCPVCHGGGGCDYCDHRGRKQQTIREYACGECGGDGDVIEGHGLSADAYSCGACDGGYYETTLLSNLP